MGVLTVYFFAPSDEAAATALDRVGGPAQPTAGPSPLPPFDTFQSKGLDPYVIMGKLEEALTGQDYWVITADPQYARVVAERGAEGSWVIKVSSPLQAALALADSDKLARAAVEWSQAEELDGASPEDVIWGGDRRHRRPCLITPTSGKQRHAEDCPCFGCGDDPSCWPGRRGCAPDRASQSGAACAVRHGRARETLELRPGEEATVRTGSGCGKSRSSYQGLARSATQAADWSS